MDIVEALFWDSQALRVVLQEAEGTRNSTHVNS